MHVKGHQWPIFLYADLAYDHDDPWSGLLRNNILVAVSSYLMLQHRWADWNYFTGIQTCLYFARLC